MRPSCWLTVELLVELLIEHPAGESVDYELLLQPSFSDLNTGSWSFFDKGQPESALCRISGREQTEEEALWRGIQAAGCLQVYQR